MDKAALDKQLQVIRVGLIPSHSWSPQPSLYSTPIHYHESSILHPPSSILYPLSSIHLLSSFLLPIIMLFSFHWSACLPDQVPSNPMSTFILPSMSRMLVGGEVRVREEKVEDIWLIIYLGDEEISWPMLGRYNLTPRITVRRLMSLLLLLLLLPILFRGFCLTQRIRVHHQLRRWVILLLSH